MKKRYFKRKKGSIILEFIIVIPALYFAAWSCMFIIMYSLSQNTAHQAAIEGARILTQELRGNTGDIPDTPEVRSLLKEKIKNSVNHYNYILLFKDKNGSPLTPDILIEPEGGCMKAVKNSNSTKLICAYTEKGISSGIEQQQIIVIIKAKFHLFVNIIPGMQERTFAIGKGTSEKEFSGRFNYWE